MSDRQSGSLRRREFLQTGAAATAAVGLAAGGLSPQANAQDKPEAAQAVLPARKMGQTGVEVTILNAGTWRAPDSLPRILRRSYAEGVRYYDTAAGYGTEPTFRQWFEENPNVRKSIFLATKQGPGGSPLDTVKAVDARLKNLGIDDLDLLFYHGIGKKHVEWPKSKEMKEACEAIKKTGKVKFVGFSTHDATKAQQIANAAEGGFVDVIMLGFSPWNIPDDLNRALDAAHKKGIALVSMKQIAGNTLEATSKNMPKVLKDRSLTPAQGLLQAIWNDERFSCTCVSMKSIEQVQEDVAAARTFKPWTVAELNELRDAVLAAGPTMCPNCDGRCARAAGTSARLGDLVRFYTYHEHHGHRLDARQSFAELTPEERDWAGADLEAARAACPNQIDFARILPETDRLLS